MRRSQSDLGFVALRVEGGLFPPEFLQKVARGEAEHQVSTDYGFTKSINVKDEIARSWRMAADWWSEYKDRRQKPGARLDKVGVAGWLVPLLQHVLGYHSIAVSEPVLVGGRSFPITHGAFEGAVPMVLATQDCDLDKSNARFGDDGRRRPPHGLLQEYLNADDRCLWGLVANGLKVRLLRDNPSLTRPACIEADLERMFGEQLYADFAAFWLIFHATRLAPRDGKSSGCILETWRRDAAKTGERALGDLRKGVTEALRRLGSGFLAHPENKPLQAALHEGRLTDKEFFQQLLRLVYRLLFLFSAEERGLLLDPNADEASQRLYRDGYALSRLRERALRRRHYDRHPDLWIGLQIVFHGLARGAPQLALPPLGGLFDEHQCPELDAAAIANEDLLRAIHALAFFPSGKTLARVNYRDMGAEELGSVYESLLELHPTIDVAASPWRFGFVGDDGNGRAKGSDRKLSGSYYTPASLVNELIKSALVPVIERTIRENAADPVAALLKLKVVDPACGSGHFLLAAARRLAAEVAQLQAGTDVADEASRHHALREVVRHCIYAVDRNPLAVELCKAALWIETIEPGRPLSFLDAHIRCGDALIGILDPKIMADSIPPEAYKALEGDDKAVCSALRKANKKRIKGLAELPLYAELAQAAAAVETMPEDTLTEVEAKRVAFEGEQETALLAQEKLRANLYVGAFFALKTAKTAEFVPLNEDLDRLASSQPARPGVSDFANHLARTYRFLHWHLVFPHVCTNTGESKGFDVILGNPPWERVKLQEQEFFSSSNREIANASNKAHRERLITALNGPNASAAERRLFLAFAEAKRQAEAVSQFIHCAGRYPMTGVGDVNTYAPFAETFLNLIGASGRSGMIVPTGIATDDSTKGFFEEVTTSGRLSSLFDIENKDGIFPAVHRTTKFSLMTLSTRAEKIEFVFFASDTEHLTDTQRRFTLTPHDIRQINPNTKTAPVFRSRADAELTKKIYAGVPVLIEEAKGENGNPWGVSFLAMFHMSNDAELFCTRAQLEAMHAKYDGTTWVESNRTVWMPLYEAKMCGIFDHRAASYAPDGDDRGYRVLPEVGVNEHADPAFSPTPYYWVSNEEVERRLRDKKNRGYLLGFRDISTAITERSFVATLVPSFGVGNSMPLILFEDRISAMQIALFVANASSVVFDYVARQKMGRLHFNYFIVKQLAFLPPSSYNATDFDIVVPRVLELTFTSHSMSPFARDLGCQSGPFAWDPDRRASVCAELDAYYAYLYGLTRDELRYILDPVDVCGEDFPSETFRVLKEREKRELGEYRTQRLVLEAWDRFMADGTFKPERINDPQYMPTVITALKKSQADKTALEHAVEELSASIAAAQRPLLFVEGQTDAEILRAAWSVFYPGTSPPFEIHAAGGTTKMTALAATGAALKKVLGGRLVCVLSDNDADGRALWNDGNLHKGGNWKPNPNGTHWCLLAPTPEFLAVADRFKLPKDYRPFTIEACFSAALRRQALAEGAYAFSGEPFAELLRNEAVAKTVFKAKLTEADDAYVYLMAPAPEAKDAFAAWITAPERRTPDTYRAFEQILAGLAKLIADQAAAKAKPQAELFG